MRRPGYLHFALVAVQTRIGGSVLFPCMFFSSHRETRFIALRVLGVCLALVISVFFKVESWAPRKGAVGRIYGSQQSNGEQLQVLTVAMSRSQSGFCYDWERLITRSR